MSGDVDNEQRAEWAAVVLRIFAKEHYHSPADQDVDGDQGAFEQALSDLLCDLMHLADRHTDRTDWPEGETWAQCLDRGAAHYMEEVAEAETEAREEAAAAAVEAERLKTISAPGYGPENVV